MKRQLTLLAILVLAACGQRTAISQIIIGGSINNGNLDRVHDVEIVPGFFLPKPDVWQNIGIRTITGPYEDEMSSEPWAGPAPTPVTVDGLLNPAPYNLDPDRAVFFKPFSGGGANGPATGHLLQDNPGTPGLTSSTMNAYSSTSRPSTPTGVIFTPCRFQSSAGTGSEAR